MVVIAIIFGVVVVGLLIYGIATHDRRVDAEDELGLPEIRTWDRAWPPLTLVVTTELVEFEERLISAVKEGARWWNNETGLNLFAGPGSLAKEGNVVPIMLAPLNSDEHEHAVAYTRFSVSESGCLRSAAVYMQPDWHLQGDPQLARAIAHELGHCLGMAHDGISESVMYRAAIRDRFSLTDKDRAFLREVYGQK